MNVVKIRKNGTFYSVFDDDCYILNFLLNYNIKNNKTGFPKSALSKVINLLEENKISYEVIGEEEKNNFKNLNRYLKFVRLGKEKVAKENHYYDLLDKVKTIDEEKLDKILSVIEKIVDE